MALLSRLSRYQDFGILLLRIGLGAMMIWHGYPKLKGGPDMWAKIGSSMSTFGMHDIPAFWGFMAAFAEAVGGLLFLIGFLFRPALLLMIITMSVAAIQGYKSDGMMGANHALELGIVFLAMFIIGPGKYSIDKA
jgi:putative oxidoreductase